MDSILKRVAGRVGELYEAIHPGEGLSQISLALDPDKRASLEILGQFPGRTAAPPGAYFANWRPGHPGAVHLAGSGRDR